MSCRCMFGVNTASLGHDALPSAAETGPASRPVDELRLFIGDDRAEDHHTVELMAKDGSVLARRGEAAPGKSPFDTPSSA